MAPVRILELIAGFLLLIAMYWAPSLVAFGRRARHWVIIALFNSLLGWTIIGWLAAFLWSILARDTPEEETIAAADIRSPLGMAFRARLAVWAKAARRKLALPQRPHAA